jgi:hypothetical protein
MAIGRGLGQLSIRIRGVLFDPVRIDRLTGTQLKEFMFWFERKRFSPFKPIQGKYLLFVLKIRVLCYI